MAKILLIRTDGIGDVLLSVPMAGVLREHNPTDEIWLLTRHYTREIGEHYPDIDGVLTIDDKTGINYSFRGLVNRLKEKNFDAAVLVHPRFYLAAALFSAGIKLRIGTGYRWYSFLFTHKVYEHRKTVEKHELEYNLGLLQPLGINANSGELKFEVSAAEIENARKILNNFGRSKGTPVIVLHPGSGGSAMEWPLESFQKLASKMVKLYNAVIVITGGESEKALLEKFREYCDVKVNILTNVLSLANLAALLKESSLVVTNSTGPLHLAAAVGTQVIGLYPPIKLCSPVRWGPYTMTDSVIQPDCKEFQNSRQAFRHAPDCMRLITVEMVMEMVSRKLHLFNNSFTRADN